jgi:hypothetical protein
VSITYALSGHASQSRSLSVDFSGFCHLRSNVPPQSLALTINRLFWYLSLTCCRATRVSSSYRQLSVLICVTYVLSCHRRQSHSLSVFYSDVCHLRPIISYGSVTLPISLLFLYGHLRPVVPLGSVALTISHLFWCLSLTFFRDIRVSHAYC